MNTPAPSRTLESVIAGIRRTQLRPGVLSSVQHPNILIPMRHIAEVVSFPTPEGTVMVRMVPGDATTLKEVPLADCSGPMHRPRVAYVHYARIASVLPPATVRTMPLDMFRYDGCVPINFDIVDADRPVAVRTDRAQPLDGLVVARFSVVRRPGWTSDRWASFLWEITPVRTLKLPADGGAF